MRRILFFAATLFATLAASVGQAQTVITSPSITQGSISVQMKQVVAAGVMPTFNSALTADFAVAPIDPRTGTGDSRFLYVGQQDGVIRTIDLSKPAGSNVVSTPFLDFRNVLNPIAGNPNNVVGDARTGGQFVDENERGLIGGAFSPDFNKLGTAGYHKFYTFTTETVASGTPMFTHQTETGAANNNSGDAGQPSLSGPGYNCQSVIREWTVNDPDANGVMTVNTTGGLNAASRIVMSVAKPGKFHNGGGITFGGDGYMYIPLGDGGSNAVSSNGANDGGNSASNNGHTDPGNPDIAGGWMGQGNAQDRRNVYGSILRVLPTVSNTDPLFNSTIPAGNNGVLTNVFGQNTNAGFRVPSSNPFVGNVNGWRPEIYAYGFRNPFRISFDKANPTNLYAGDVGQDRTTANEEVDKVVAGGNYGWVIKTGTDIYAQANTNQYSPNIGVPLLDPIAEYPTSATGNGGLGVIGGFVYRGSLIPALQGMYVFGDLMNGNSAPGRLLYTNPNDPSLQVFDLNIQTGQPGTIGKPSSQIHGVGQDANGEIYFLYGDNSVVMLVPEPASWALALIGAAPIGWRMRRKRDAISR